MIKIKVGDIQNILNRKACLIFFDRVEGLYMYLLKSLWYFNVYIFRSNFTVFYIFKFLIKHQCLVSFKLCVPILLTFENMEQNTSMNCALIAIIVCFWPEIYLVSFSTAFQRRVWCFMYMYMQPCGALNSLNFLLKIHIHNTVSRLCSTTDHEIHQV